MYNHYIGNRDECINPIFLGETYILKFSPFSECFFLTWVRQNIPLFCQALQLYIIVSSFFQQITAHFY